jgi:hypothetical protein
MRIELLKTVKHDGRTYTQTDVLTVDDDLGKYFCENGWAKDLANVVPTAEPSTAPVELKVQSTKHVNKAKEL